MRLELGIIKIKDVQFGEETIIEDGTLYVNKSELIALALQDNRLSDAEVELARPGEEVRIIPVKDVIEPRVKVSGSGEVFPGTIGKMGTVGSGRTNVLRGAAIVTVGRIIGYQEGFIDMTGPGAKYSPFSQPNNVALILHPVDGLAPHAHEEAVRLAGLRAAAYLGKAGKDVTPDGMEAYELSPPNDTTLPRVAYVYTLLSEGLLHDTYLYGADVKKILPTLIHPNEVMDGAIVSGNCVSACDKHTTYHHLNNPVIKDLYRRHGKDLNFIGVVTANLNVSLTDKERTSDYASKLVKLIGADGAILTQEGFGNPDSDLMMLCKKMEEYGIKTVLITDEYAGRDGSSQSLADAVPQADAVISVGNANEMITLPPMKHIIGDLKPIEVIAGGFVGCMTACGGINIEIQSIMGSTCQLGYNKLTARGY
ncbi:glycine/sarcosine/betaine reductase component B subunit [candidate division WOR-3 bacterium]|nr:glycine/sarcosine/betaine reductase component B subunit [candidate division WOR-3 bacterium]